MITNTILNLPDTAAFQILQLIGPDHLTISSVNPVWKKEYDRMTHGSKSTLISLAADSVGKFNIFAECLHHQLGLNPTLQNMDEVRGVMFKIFVSILQLNGVGDHLPLTSQHQLRFVNSVLNGEYRDLIPKIILVIIGIKLRSYTIIQSAISEQRTFKELFGQLIGDENRQLKSVAFFLIAEFGVEFLLEIVGPYPNIYFTPKTLTHAIMYLRTEDIELLCADIHVKICHAHELVYLLRGPMLLPDFQLIALLRDLGIRNLGNDEMVRIVLAIFSVESRRDVLVDAFEELIFTLRFSDEQKARLIIELALREDEEHLLAFSRQSPFDLNWCFQNINGDDNDDNRIALEFLSRLDQRHIF